MATYEWLSGASNDLSLAANWGGTTPGNNDTARIFVGAQDITANVDWSAKTGLTIELGGEFVGSIGTAANPWRIGSATKFTCDTSRMKWLYLRLDACTDLVILATPASATGCYLTTGAVTNFHIGSCGQVRIGSVTITKLNINAQSNASKITIESTATVTAVDVSGAALETQAGVSGTVRLFNSAYMLASGAGTPTFGAIEAYTGTTAEIRARATLTAAKAFGGTIDCSQSDDPKTVTNSETWAGGLVDIQNGPNNCTATNAIKIYGGRQRGFPSSTPLIPAVSL